MMRNGGDGIEHLRGDVQTILLALHACKTPLASEFHSVLDRSTACSGSITDQVLLDFAASTAAQLQSLLDDPYRALPSSIHFNACPGGVQMQNQSGNRTGGGINDMDVLLRTNYPNSDFGSSGLSVHSPFTPPLSTPSSVSNVTTTNSSAASSSNEKTFQEIDETLTKNGFFGSLGDNSFGPELDALIHGSRASAPWMLSGNIVNSAPTPPSHSNGSNSRNDGAQFAMVSRRFEELESSDLTRMGSFSDIFGNK
jgi:hypothetical protein